METCGRAGGDVTAGPTLHPAGERSGPLGVRRSFKSFVSLGELEGRSPWLDRMVAVKMLLRGGLAPLTNDGRERFRREALALSQLSHAGIATVFDFDSEEDHDFLVMEFVPGGTLESRLREGPLPLVQIQSLGAAIASNAFRPGFGRHFTPDVEPRR
jgi:serine/threonine protein kinase